ncbi:autotransporter outer membrane beta-barrel domain-containing protein [Bradyrhizobium betae]|nr:autotransporter domain-containing protein [Bradyrhizobium betae]
MASTSLSSVRAQTWGGAGSTTTTADYNLGTNWSTAPAGAPPVNAGQAATFSSTGSATVTVTAGPITPDSWTFGANAKSFTISGQAVNFNGAGPNIVNNASAGQSISISNNMTGTAISQAAASTLTLSGTNSFTTASATAGTLVNGGSLTTSVTNSATFRNNATLAGSVSNTGTLDNNGGTITGAVTQSAGTTTNSGSINAGMTLTGGTLTTTGTIQTQLSSTNSTVNAQGTVSAVFNMGTSVLNVTGALSTDNTWLNSGTAQLLVSGGDLTGIHSDLNNSSTSANAVVVSATRTLNLAAISNNSGTFTNNGTVTVAPSGTLNNTGAQFVNSGTMNSAVLNYGTYTQTAGSTNGGITNSNGTVIASGGALNGANGNFAAGTFSITGIVTANSTFDNNGTGRLLVSGGDFTGLTALTNNSTSASAVQVSAGRTLGATSIANNAGTFTNGGTVTTTAGITNAAGATFTSTGTVNGGLTNAGTVNAAGTINGGITNQTGGNFTVTGNLLANGAVTAGDGAYFTVSGGDITGISTFTNNAAGMIYFTQINAGRSLTAANVVNNGNMIVSGTVNATNSFANAFGGNLVVDTTGRINGSVDTAGGYIQLYGTINGNLTLSGSLASMNSYGGSVSGRVNLAASGSQVYSTSGGATYGSLAGVAGTQADVGGFTLTVGGDNSDSTFAGSMTGTGNFVKTGSGTMLLSGDSGTYTGTTTVNAGTLMVNGSLGASAVTVGIGGALNGSGTLGATQVNAGGLLAPGSFTPGTSMTLASLAMQSDAAYLVFVNPTTSTFATVTGNASLGGATVGVAFIPGSYVAKRYTILSAGSITGSFDPTVLSLGLPTGFHTSLSQDTNHAYLNLALDFAPPSGGLNGNQQNVGNAIINFFNTNGTIPMAFGGLGPAGLAQLSGEVGSAPQQTTFGAMIQFMGVMTDPFVAGRDDAVGPDGASNAYAEESIAYAASGKGGGRREREAYAAMSTKAPPAPSFGQRWSVWAAGFGGSQTTDGSIATGSNNTTSSLYGTAVGADYRISRNTLVGFALAGGGTNFTAANNLGGGRSDLFQAGVHVRHVVGPAYISGAFAYGWQDVVTDRTVTVAGVDRLRAEFNANAYSGRLEGGYRFVKQGIGLAPYAAAQFTIFDLPSYAEHAIVGTDQFALAYNGKSVTDTRSELGLRTDKSFAASDGIVTLRGRAAWAHDFNPDRAVGATFQALPGASFVVNGAAMAADAALVTGAIERKWLNGWSAAATFEGEFSNVTRSYAGKGVVRYAW